MSAVQSGGGAVDPVPGTQDSSSGGDYLPQEPAGKRAEILLVSAAILSIVVSTIAWSSLKQAWVDEVFTWNELRDPSLPHLLRAILHGADGGMPVFYITGWLWCHTFGDGVLTLRLYSCCCFCLALVLIWRTLRRYYGVWPSAVGVLGTWCTSNLLLYQCADARFYGLYVLALAATMRATLRLAETDKPSRRWLATGFLCEAVLVLTHMLAAIYGVLMVAALIASDRLSGRPFRWQIYLSQAAGWLSLLLWLPGIRATVAAGKPHGWIPRPTVIALMNCFNFGLFQWWMLLVSRYHTLTFGLLWTSSCALLLVVIRRAIRESFPGRPVGKRRSDPQRTLTIFGLSLLTAPLIALLLSLLVTPILLSRYLLPSLIGFTILFARHVSVHFSAFRARKWLRFGVVVILLITPLLTYPIVQRPDPENLDVEIAAIQAIPPDSGPIVVGNIREFMPLMRYLEAAKTERFEYLLDWESALKQYPAAVSDYHLMLANKQSGYFAGRILFADDFLCSHSRFMILDAPTGGLFDTAIRPNPNFRWSIAEVLDKNRYVFVVIQATRPPACARP